MMDFYGLAAAWVAIGLLVGLFGYALFRIAVVLAGATVGGLVGYHLGALFGGEAVALAVGMIGAVGGIVVFAVGVLLPLCLFGVSVGLGIGHTLGTHLALPDAWNLLFLTALALLGGALFVRARRGIITAATALLGALLVADALFFIQSSVRHGPPELDETGGAGGVVLFYHPAPLSHAELVAYGIAWLVLFFTLMLMQHRLSRSMPLSDRWSGKHFSR